MTLKWGHLIKDATKELIKLTDKENIFWPSFCT